MPLRVGASISLQLKSLKVTPAMKAGIASHVWTIEEIVRLMAEPEAKKRGAYKPRVLKAA